MLRLLALIALTALAAAADMSRCACDPALPETMKARECSLCLEAEKQPAGVDFFYLKDINPRKPNRMLALPRNHASRSMADLPLADRTAFWKAAIAKGRELWGDKWGLAYNGDLVRTQCHLHIHIGRLLEGVETDNHLVVDGPEQIPAPKNGSGLWVHAHGDRLHVHVGEHLCETVLYR